MNLSPDLMSVESLKSVAPTDVGTFLKAIDLMEKNVKELDKCSQQLGETLQMSMEGTLGKRHKLGDPMCVEIQRAYNIHSRKETVINQLHDTISPYASNWLSAAFDEIVQQTNTIFQTHREFCQDPESWKKTRGIQALGDVHKTMRSYNQTIRAATICSQALMNKGIDQSQESKAATLDLSHRMKRVHRPWNDDTASYKSEAIQWATQVFTELKSECEDFLRLIGSAPLFSIGDERSDWERELASSRDRLKTLYMSAAPHKEDFETLCRIVGPNHECWTACEAWGKISGEVKNAFKTLNSRGAQGSSLDSDSLASVLDDL